MKLKKFLIPIFLTLSLLITIFVLAGDIDSAVGEPDSTMYTLEDIYKLIHNNTTATEGDHDLFPDSSPTATSSYSVSQIYADLANLIKRENVATGTVYLGVTGAYDTPDPAYATTTIIASSLTPSGTAGDPTGYSLEDIWNLIDQNSTTTAASHDDSPAGAPTNSMHSLTDIYNALVDLGNEKSSSVNPDITYLGAVGTYDASCGSGSGLDADDPYHICTWAQLNSVRQNLGWFYVLNNDLDSNSPGYGGLGNEWAPIGDCGDDNDCDALNNHPLSGSFNGGGKTISDLIINKPNLNGVGLFAYVNSGSVSNLGLINARVTGKGSVGTLIGAQYSGTVSDSYSADAVVAGSTSGAGGLIGYVVSNAVPKAEINNTYASATVSGVNYAGGLIGYGGGNISNSYSEGEVSGSGILTGGFIGYYGDSGGTISRSYSTASVTGTSYVGGLTGEFLGGLMIDCYSTGDVDGSGEGIGGLTGWHYGGVASSSFSISKLSGGTSVGGLTGMFVGGDYPGSFWDIETSTVGTTLGGGTGTTTAAMQTPATFTDAGWSEGIWTLVQGSYPSLGF